MSRKNSFISEVDKFIGSKIYDLRLATGLSRSQLAILIGVSHQQLEKYEKGTNRMSVGRLILIGKALGENLSYFYRGIGLDSESSVSTQHQRMCIELSRNFMRIEDSKQRAAINTLVKSLVKVD